jgi:hypothetical protein
MCVCIHFWISDYDLLCSGLESGEYGRRDPLCWPRNTLYPQKLALTSSTSGGRSVGIVRSRAQAKEYSFWIFYAAVSIYLSLKHIKILRWAIDTNNGFYSYVNLYLLWFLTTILYAFLLSSICAKYDAPLILLDLIIVITFDQNYQLWSPSSCHEFWNVCKLRNLQDFSTSNHTAGSNSTVCYIYKYIDI